MLKLKLSLTIVTLLVVILIVASFSVSFAEKDIDRKIIVFQKSATDDVKVKYLKENNAEKIKELKGINALVVKVSKGKSLKNDTSIAYIEDDIVISLCKKPAKKPRPTPTPVPAPSEVIPWGIEYMGAPDIWGTVDTDNIKVGIIDTGIDLDHPDLSANIKGGFNAIKKKKSYNDDNGHGTHVAGIIGAVDNDIGVIGMMPDADLYAIKALDSNGNGYLSDLIESIDWAIDNNMDIINMSLSTTTDSESLHSIIINASNAGIKIVAAAGNNYGNSSEYPAAYPEVTGVGAIDQNGNIASFSAVQGVDTYAPGVDIYSTYIGGSYTTMDGTSMAAPHEVY
jgi:subtilisin family serine protease